jgi:regulator of RNase E activity RraB
MISLPQVELVLKTHAIKNLFDEHSKREIGNLHDAYEVANEIESSEVNNLFKMLSSEFISSEKKKTFILAEIDEHRRQIMNLPERFEDGMKEIKIEGE